MKSKIYANLSKYIQLFRDLQVLLLPLFLENLDLTGFIVPKKRSKLDKDIKLLEQLLDCYIVPYDTGIFRLDIPVEAHLCALVKGAKLTLEQLRSLQKLELDFRPGGKKFNKSLPPKGVSFVAYQKPLTLKSPYSGFPYELYKIKGLL